MLCIDNWGPISTSSEGVSYSLVGIDHFSKAATVILTAIMNAEVSIHFNEMAFSMLGRYNKILTDSGPYFTSARFKEWCEGQKVELHIATPAHPEANRCCERSIRTCQQSLVKCGAHTLNWHNHISTVVNGYNNCCHSSIRYTPITCHFTKPIFGEPKWDSIVNQVNKRRGDMVAKDKKDAISVGDSVFVVPRIRNIKKHASDCHFRDRKWGPATILEVLDENKFKVTFEGKVHTVNGWELSKTSL
jgi:hypothetical protein